MFFDICGLSSDSEDEQVRAAKSIEVLCDVKNADIKRDQQDENLGF